MYTCMYVCMPISIHIYMCVCVYINVMDIDTHTFTYAHAAYTQTCEPRTHAVGNDQRAEALPFS